jgi:ferredoxin
VVKIAADRDKCIGAGMCVMTDDAVFDQDDDGVVVVLTGEVPAGEDAKVRDAVNLCPSGALALLQE